MLYVIIATAMIVSILAGFFALQNAAPVIVTFFRWKLQASMALVVLVTLVLGIIVGICVSLPSIIRKSILIASFRRQMEENKGPDPEVRNSGDDLG